jgi:DNA polymerase-3 subunit alpha
MQLAKEKKTVPRRELFKESPKPYKLPALDPDPLQNAFDQMELIGFPLESPFDLLDNPPNAPMRANMLHKMIGKRVRIEGYLITVKNTKTSNFQLMNFGNFVDRDGDFIDTVHFPEAADRFPFTGRGVYLIEGIVMEEFGVTSIEVSKMERLAFRNLDDE